MAEEMIRTTCCVCTKDIDGAVVEFCDYDLKFHPDCFVNTSGPQMLHLIEVDTTLVRSRPGARTGLRVNNPLNIRADGVVEGEQEVIHFMPDLP